MRAAAVVLADDPILGKVAYGGKLADAGDMYKIIPQDGVFKRFHYVAAGKRLHLELKQGRFDIATAIEISKDMGCFRFEIECEGMTGREVEMIFSQAGMEGLGVYLDGEMLGNGCTSFTVGKSRHVLEIRVNG